MATVQTTVNGNQQSQDALSVLLQQLMGGGTQAMQQRDAGIAGEINANQALRARYSPEAALTDAQGLIAQQLRQAMEKSLPAITRSAEGAGASGNALRALLTQDALAKAAESSSALGVQAVQGYGQVGANLSQILASLVTNRSAGTEEILKAIQLMQQSQQEVESSGGAGGGSGGSVGRPSSGGGRTDSVLGMPSTDNFFYRPGGVLANAQLSRTQPATSFGPLRSDEQILKSIQGGLTPSQDVNSVQGVNNLYRGAYSF